MARQLEYLKAVQSEMDSDFGEFRKLVRDRANHIRKMIITYSRRLEILELQQKVMLLLYMHSLQAL